MPQVIAKLFKNGRSQAVRLPKQFRFEGDEVYVSRQGKKVVLVAKAASNAISWKEFVDRLPRLPERFMQKRPSNSALKVRDSLK